MARYRSKPVEIEAVQWFKEGDHPAVFQPVSLDGNAPFHVKGAQGWATVNVGDWIIPEPRGDGFYPCNPDVFAQKYEEIT